MARNLNFNGDNPHSAEDSVEERDYDRIFAKILKNTKKPPDNSKTRNKSAKKRIQESFQF